MDASEAETGRSSTGDSFEQAIAALATRERTIAELERWLRERGHPEAEVANTLERLIAIGELDDERFARRYAEDKRELSGWGADRIREALTRRGLGREIVEAAITDGGELERAVALLERRADRPVDERSRARALGYLARRGYDSEIAHEAVRRAG